jgi:hypothetical protein
MMLFGRILQHDDDIPSPELNKAFNRNSYDWKVTNPPSSALWAFGALTFFAELVPHGLFIRCDLHRFQTDARQRARNAIHHETSAQQRLDRGMFISVFVVNK